MKILFVSAVLPYPLHSGGQIRIYNLLKRLSKIHEIHLYSFIRSGDETKYLNELTFCKRVVMVNRGRVWQPKYIFKTLTSSYPLLWSSYHSSEMLGLLADEISLGTYDLVHIEPGYVWPSIPTEHRIPIVVAEHNIEHTVYESYANEFKIGIVRPLLLRDVVKMELWQRHVWKQAAQIITVSETDKKFIHQSNVSVVPNGVDIKSFAFRPKKSMSASPTFLYVGNFRWMENKDAAEYLVHNWWPLIQEKYPGSHLRIVGPHAPRSHYYVGAVDKIQDEFTNADVLLAPIRVGGGTKYKILEAMASGLPVITTGQGIAGMDVAGSVCVVKEPRDVLQSLERLKDNTKRLSMIQQARKIIEKQYSWDLIAQKLDHVWNSLS
jgi:polysaccharide biosynthesis protein PslH